MFKINNYENESDEDEQYCFAIYQSIFINLYELVLTEK